MSNQLELFIKSHRQEFDTFEPSLDLWNKIDANVQAPKMIKGKLSWLKYFGFSASMVALFIGYKAFISTSDDTQKVNKTIRTTTLINNITEKMHPIKGAAIDLPPTNFTKLQPIAPKRLSTQVTQIDSVINHFQENPIAMPLSDTMANPTSTLAHKHTSFAKTKYVKSTKTSKNNTELITDTLFYGINTLEITATSFANIDIKGIVSQQIKLNAVLDYDVKGLVVGDRPDYELRYQKMDSVLLVHVENKSKNEGVMIGYINENVSLDFEVPASTTIKISTNAGDVSVSGLVGKPCTIEAKFGDVTLNNIVMSPDIRLKMNSGDLLLSHITGNIHVESTFGDEEFNNIYGNLIIKSSSGDIQVNKLGGNILIDSQFGDISLESTRGNIIVNQASGDLQGNHVEIVEKMIANLTFGDIEMEIVNDINDLSFELETNFGELSIEKDKEKIKSNEALSIKRGKILIKSITKSGDQRYQ